MPGRGKGAHLPLMPALPRLASARIHLRPFADDDAAAVFRLAGDARIADTTALIPHPYPEGAAEAWIATHEAAWELGRGLTLAVTLRASAELIGATGLTVAPEHQRAELGYWIGVPYWRQGYATEAARLLVDYAFGVMKLHRIFAHHFVRNPASGRVLEKIGMTREGCLRHAFLKDGRFEDLAYYGLLREEWDRRRG